MPNRYTSIVARWLPLVLLVSPGCLLAADTPEILDICVNESLESEVGPGLVRDQVAASDDTIFCADVEGEGVEGRNDLVYAWTAPLTGNYRFRVDSEGGRPVIGLAEPACEGSTFACEHADPAPLEDTARDFVELHRYFEAGTTVAVVLEDDAYTASASRTGSSAELILGIELLGGEPLPDPGADWPPSTICPFVNDNYCDEPSGSGACPPGTDVDDCTCEWENDGYCDVPGYCPEGTDVVDCG